MQQLGTIVLPDSALERASRICSTLQLEGHRGELALVRAARALVAFEGRSIVEPDDIDNVAVMCLLHRLRKAPFDPIAPQTKIEEALASL